MNLETIQSKLQDIEQMRSISTENEASLMRWKGRNGTDMTQEPVSSLSFRFLLAVFALGFLIYADYKELPGSRQLLRELEGAISYNIKAEDMEKLEDIWYTISDNIQNQIPIRKDKEHEE